MAIEDVEYGGELFQESIRTLVQAASVRPNHSNPSNVSICMVPETLRNLNKTAYTPRIIAIGPLHKEEERLKAMEDLKLSYMTRLFSRIENDVTRTIHECMQLVFGLVEQTRACYAPSSKNMGEHKWAEMMVIDGCFILELLYKFQFGIAEGDPIFDNSLILHDVRYDLLLLENQIPLLILEVLFRLTVQRILPSTSLTNLIFYFFKDMNILNDVELTTEDEVLEHCHILGLLQSCYRPRDTNWGQTPGISYSATEFAGAGVTFKANGNQKHPLAVIFKQSSLIPWLGTLLVRETSLKIPVLCIKDSTQSFLRNLIAYEQCYPLSRNYVTSFAFLMDRLIDTKDDVAMLVRSKVLHHNLGTPEDVTNLFNNICNGVVVQAFCYSNEWKQLDEYCNRFWPSLLISLRNIYITTTWKTLTIIAAVIIFVLTLIQTIYSVLNA